MHILHRFLISTLVLVPALWTFSSSAVAATPASVSIDSPRGGWRENTRENADYSQTVNYPAALVNARHDQADSARIRGQILARRKPSSPATLIVNGVAMPLKTDEDGRFDRPYLFARGSNSVEVRDGTRQRRVQFYDVGTGATRARLRILLSWDTDNTDLDLHVITPDGQHSWYGSRALGNGGALDMDVTTGFGPEIFSSPAPQRGTYLVYVNYYGGGYGGDEDNASGQSIMTTARLTILTEEGTPNEKQESFIVPMRAAGELTLARRFAY